MRGGRAERCNPERARFLAALVALLATSAGCVGGSVDPAPGLASDPPSTTPAADVGAERPVTPTDVQPTSPAVAEPRPIEGRDAGEQPRPRVDVSRHVTGIEDADGDCLAKGPAEIVPESPDERDALVAHFAETGVCIALENGTIVLRPNEETYGTSDATRDTDGDALGDAFEGARAHEGVYDPLVPNRRFAILYNPFNHPSQNGDPAYADQYRQLLVDRHAFRSEDIVVRKGTEATWKRFEADVRAVGANATARDLVFTILDGHGSMGHFGFNEGIDTAGEELDYSPVPGSYASIRDLFAARAPGPLQVFVVDASYSGTAVDDLRGERIVTITSAGNETGMNGFAPHLREALGSHEVSERLNLDPRHCLDRKADRGFGPNDGTISDASRAYLAEGGNGDGRVSLYEAHRAIVWAGRLNNDAWGNALIAGEDLARRIFLSDAVIHDC